MVIGSEPKSNMDSKNNLPETNENLSLKVIISDDEKAIVEGLEYLLVDDGHQVRRRVAAVRGDVPGHGRELRVDQLAER